MLTKKSLAEFFYEAVPKSFHGNPEQFREHLVLASVENVEGLREDGLEHWVLSVYRCAFPPP
jgi:hypothetical protein